jgi:hypothetical protein
MSPAAPSNHCRVCETPSPDPFFRLEDVPVQDGLLWPTPRQAADAPTGNIELVFCPSCGYIGNRAFDPSRLRYDPGYDISLHHSPVYQRFIEELVDRLVGAYDLRRKDIIEIGSGKGDFLRALCGRGENRGLGFDPTSTADDEPGGVRIRREFYSERFAAEPADLLCCRHVLNSIADLRGFVAMVRRALGDRTRSVVYFEMPNGAVIFRRGVVWNVVYEHCSYFTAPSLDRLFTDAGFAVRSIAPCFQQEYLGLEASPTVAADRAPFAYGADVAALAAETRAFGDLYRQKVARWEAWLRDLRRAGRTTVAWGAGARAVSFLSALTPGAELPFLVDINPKRQGLFMPRTAQRVASPESLAAKPPDAILITNPAFEAEIRSQAAVLGLNSEIVVLD